MCFHHSCGAALSLLVYYLFTRILRTYLYSYSLEISMSCQVRQSSRTVTLFCSRRVRGRSTTAWTRCATSSCSARATAGPRRSPCACATRCASCAPPHPPPPPPPPPTRQPCVPPTSRSSRPCRCPHTHTLTLMRTRSHIGPVLLVLLLALLMPIRAFCSEKEDEAGAHRGTRRWWSPSPSSVASTKKRNQISNGTSL